MSDRNMDHLCDELKPLAQEFLDNCNADPVLSGRGLRVFITETYRYEDEQDADYAKGRTAPGKIITNAKYGQSPHNCVNTCGEPAAKAFDFAIEDIAGVLDWNASDPYWQRAIQMGEELGLVSGSTFHSPKDSPHFELANWKK